MRDIEITGDDIRHYREDGFIIFENFLESDEIERLRSRFPRLFRGEWETGLPPDEINWQEGRDGDDKARQLCNTWKSDHTIASVVLRPEIGRIAAALAGWPGTRIHLDNVVWKPPGAGAVLMHQDGSWLDYMVPPNMTSLWMALDDTQAGAGTIEYVRGSNRWRHTPKPKGFLLDDYQHLMLEEAKAAGVKEPEIVSVELPAGGLVVHDCWTWHGSGPNTKATKMRRAVVVHCTRSDTVYHPTNNTHLYIRYRRRDTDAFDESFFPVLWRGDGYRTAWLDDYMSQGSAVAGAAT
jgi:ectoine hydroxylase-related dioxygenase (phytanoyl-CoA dioxygenase family)